MQRGSIFRLIVLAIFALTDLLAAPALALVPRDTGRPDFPQPSVIVPPPVVELPSKETIRILSDDDLRGFAKLDFDKKEMSGKLMLLGLHRDIPVIVWYQCSDLCPQMTARIIFYQLSDGMTCAAAGGSEDMRATALPADSATIFCVPAALR